MALPCRCSSQVIYYNLKFVAPYPEEARKILTLSLYQEPKILEERTRVTRKVGFPWEKTAIPKS